MKKIGLISDTHGTFDGVLRDFLGGVDEIWHAGDIGSVETADSIAAFKPLRAVYGNIDDGVSRRMFSRFEYFSCEGVTVLMTHIGGYPGHYEKESLRRISELHPRIFISGHSHILKIIYDRRNDTLHLNPGAAGCYGFHNVRTALRFVIDGSDIRDMEIGEWPRQ